MKKVSIMTTEEGLEFLCYKLDEIGITQFEMVEDAASRRYWMKRHNIGIMWTRRACWPRQPACASIFPTTTWARADEKLTAMVTMS